tara:strand:+ start:4012 stop:4332 length:321 start_codon:yes stop_codon:yes gene_type:complete
MDLFSLDKMTRGWFVGSFEPTVLKTDSVEVAIKEYKKGSIEDWHFHKVATEITAIVAGKVRMNDKIYSNGDIIKINPSEGTDFECLEDTITVVVKVPGAMNDKYLK